MPRAARIYTGTGIFHILTRGNNKQWVFKDDTDFRAYKSMLKDIKAEQPFKLYHYCLMNNHVHLIIETNKDTELSKLMKRLNLLYYHYYKKRYGYTGHFWQDRFKSLLIEKDKYLIACGVYIEHNPVRAKMIRLAQDYPYSSYSYYAYGKADDLIDRDICYDCIGQTDKARQYEYRQFKASDQINERTFNQLFLGSNSFVKQMEDKFKINNTRLERGRPKKNGEK